MAIFDFLKQNKPSIVVADEAISFGRNDNSSGLNSHNEIRTSKWISFGDTNQFPNYLNNLVNSSGLHSAIIDYKKSLISGSGYEILGDAVLTPMQKVELKQFTDLIDGKRNLASLIQDITLDYLVHGTVYLKIYWNSDKTRILKAERIEPSRLRSGYNKLNPEVITEYYYSLDWSNYGQWGVTKFPAFNKEVSERKPIEIYRWMVPNSAMLFNTLPSYTAATNWIQLDGEVSNYHKSNIENSLNPGVIIKFYKTPANDEEKRGIVNGIKKNYAGSSNTGKAMVFFSSDKETAPDIEPIEVSNIDKQFSVTADSIQRNICYAHRINPSLMGLKTPGSLGSSTELETSFDIFKEVVVTPSQYDIENIINKFITMNGLPVKIKLNDADLIYSTKITE